MSDSLELFRRYAPMMAALGAGPLCDISRFILHDAPKLQIVYAPFDWVNTQARVAVVGITPGRHSMAAAFRAAGASLRGGKSVEQAARDAKQTGSFSNMRGAIASMLDALGVAAALRIESTFHLFGGKDAGLLHATSCVRYPVLYKNQKQQNYTGHSPPLMKYATFVSYIENTLAPELQALPHALIVPCGEAVSQAIEHLARQGKVDATRCLIGFPHASGANGHRKRHFEERRDKLLATVSRWANN